MRVYVSGPMTGHHDLNHPAFAAATAQLRSLGHEVVNPAELEGGDSWESCLRRDLIAMMACDAIAMLPGWGSSRGANLEIYVAKALGFKVIDLTVD